MSQNTDTPQDTLRTATREGAMKQAWATLLGTVIKPDTVRALVRFSSGKIRTVTLGDKIGRGTVMAIEDGIVVLALDGDTRKLAVPGD